MLRNLFKDTGIQVIVKMTSIGILSAGAHCTTLGRGSLGQ